MKIAFKSNATKPKSAAMKKALAETARRIGLKVVPCKGADVIIVLGGDGTILRTAHEFQSIPLLGFNLGGLGYLSSVEEKSFTAALEALRDGRFTLSERTMLEVSIGGKKANALNEIAVRGGFSGRAALLDLESDGRRVTKFLADGLVVATPTGSTAYSLSAGGPVVLSGVKSFVLTPLNPHALGTRPMVIGDDVRLSVTLRPRSGEKTTDPVGVYADGELVFEMTANSTAEIRRADTPAKLVELEDYDPFGIMSRKLGWSGSNVK